MTEFKPIPLTETQMAELFRLRQRVAELEKELEVEEKRFSAQWELLSSVTAERDKATQYWQIAEGRCDALMKQRDELLAACEALVQIKGIEAAATGQLQAALEKAKAAIAIVKEKA